MTEWILRQSTPEDADIILNFIIELARFEKLEHKVITTHQEIVHAFFCENPKVFCLIAEVANEPVGFAIYFYNFSTFLGQHGIYIEDIYVHPDFRGKGIGKAIFHFLAHKALDEGCGRIEWWVLDWNASAIAFYQSLGAQPMDEYTVFRLDQTAIKKLADSCPLSTPSPSPLPATA
jgi:GNAT superfamily N-acetyltransferase